MALHTSADYTVSVEVARRAGLYGRRYLTPDGRVILSESELRRVRLEPDEYVTGLDARLITTEEKQQLIHDGGYRMLPDGGPVKDGQDAADGGREAVEENDGTDVTEEEGDGHDRQDG